MTILRRFLIALLAVASLATGAAHAASTTNYSDQWWIPTESGWGASVLQQWDTLFVDIFVYGSDNKPTWFTGAAYYQSSSPGAHATFTGDLYATTGPYYGGPFNPSAVGFTKVGTLTFDADTVNTATLSYTVNGVPVTKSVTRQTWRNENLGGSYYGGWAADQVSCVPASDNGHFETAGTIQITHNADNSVTIRMLSADGEDDLLLVGTYAQQGHMGQITATMNAPSVNLAVNVFELETNPSGFSGRFNGSAREPNGDSCQIVNGRLGGVRR